MRPVRLQARTLFFDPTTLKRRLVTLGFGGVLLAGSVVVPLFSQEAGAETQQVGTPLSNSAARTTQATMLTPEQEAALVEVRKILREAREVAEARVIENPESKDGKFLVHNKRSVLLSIVDAQARAGDIEEARLTATANGWDKSPAIGIAYAKAGQPYEALKTVDTRNLRPQDLEVILEALHKSGDGRTALEVIENVYVPWDRAEALFLYARFLVKMRDPAANAFAQRAYVFSNTLAKGQPWVYVRLAEFQVDAGDSTSAHQNFQKARDAALAVPDVQQQLKGLKMVAKAQAQNMDQSGSEKTYAEAIRIAKGLPSKQQEIELGEIARAQLGSGNRTAATKTIRDLLQTPNGPSPYDQATGLMRQARWHLTFGDIEAAKSTLQTVVPRVRGIAVDSATPELEKSTIYYELARLAADSGLYGTALEAVRAIENGQTKAGLMKTIVTGLVSTSEQPEVQQFIQTLVKDATSLTGILSFPRDLTLRDVAVIQAAAGDAPAAVRTADRVVDALRAQCYGQMVGIFHKKGEWTWAHEVMSKMKRDWVVDESSHQRFQALTRAEARAGFSKQAREWASTQQIGFARAYALLGVAEGLMDYAGIEQLLPIVLQ